MLGHDLSEETKTDIENQIDSAYLEIKGKKFIDKFIDDLKENFQDYVDSYLKYDSLENYKHRLAYEVHQVMTKLLLGDIEILEALRIPTEFTFDSLHEIRLKIWEICATDIENSIINAQLKEIEQLEKDIKFYRRDY
jgi:hypothetical protein